MDYKLRANRNKSHKHIDLVLAIKNYKILKFIIY